MIDLSRLISEGGIWAVALLMFAENVFPPIPSELVLPFTGFLVERGDLGALAAFAAATAGSTAGALALYVVGRFGGRALLLRHHRLFRLSEQDLDRADDWFDRHGSTLVLVGRMIPFVRSVISVPAGTSEMPVARFVLLTLVGSAVWNALLITLGAAFGDRYEQITELVGRVSTVVVVVLGVAAVSAALLWYRSRRDRHV